MKDSEEKSNEIYKWVLLGFLWVAYFLQQGTRQIYNAVLPQIQNDFQVDSVSMGLVATTFTFTYGICVPFAGIASDMFKRKWMIIAGIFLFCIGIFTSAFASSIGMLFITYGLLNGMGQSFYFPSASSLMGQLHEKMRSTAFSIHQTAQYLGIVICSCVSGYLGSLPSQGGFAGWKLPFLLFGGIGILWAVFLVFGMRDTKQKTAANGEEIKASFKDATLMMFKKPSAIILSLAFGFMVYVDIGFKTWTPAYLFEKFDMSMGEAALNAVVWHYLGAFIGVMVGSRVIDRLANRGIKTIRFDADIFGYICAAPFIFLMVHVSSLGWCIAWLFAFGIFKGVCDAGIFASFFDVVAPRYRASAMGIMLCVGFVIGSTASTILGFMRDHFGLTIGISSLSLLYVVNAAIIFLARRYFFHKDYEEC